jgi:hypothetical protein
MVADVLVSASNSARLLDAAHVTGSRARQGGGHPERYPQGCPPDSLCAKILRKCSPVRATAGVGAGCLGVRPLWQEERAEGGQAAGRWLGRWRALATCGEWWKYLAKTETPFHKGVEFLD